MGLFTRRSDRLSTLCDQVTSLTEGIGKLSAAFAAREESDRTPNGLADIVGRVEALERRIEQIHADAIRHYQRAFQKLKRAEEIEGEESDEGQQIEIPAELMTQPVHKPDSDGPVDDDPLADLAWAHEQISKMGIQPS